MHTGMHAYVHMHTCACLRACACTQTELLDEGFAAGGRLDSHVTYLLTYLLTELLDEGFAAGGRLDSHVECPLDDHAVVRLEAHLR